MIRNTRPPSSLPRPAHTFEASAFAGGAGGSGGRVLVREQHGARQRQHRPERQRLAAAGRRGHQRHLVVAGLEARGRGPVLAGSAAAAATIAAAAGSAAAAAAPEHRHEHGEGRRGLGRQWRATRGAWQRGTAGAG